MIRNRLAQYHEKTEPLIDYYEARGLLRRVDGDQPPEEVTDRIRALLATLRMEEEALRLAMYRGGIIIKTPRADRADGGRRRDPGPLPEDAALEGARRA